MSDFLEVALAVPHFPRLDEWFGCWVYEPNRFMAQLSFLQRMDFAKHAAEYAESRAQAEPSDGLPYAAVANVRGTNVGIVRVGGLLMKQAPSTGGTSTIALRRSIRTLANDPNVASILLMIDSPGGTAAGTADLAADVKAARRKKPVWAQVEDAGLSAAYWVASQAERVFANADTALVGSIGTVMTVYDASRAADREGVQALVFATGPLKGAGSPGAPVTEEQRAYFQGIVDETQASFDAAVMSGRNMSADQLAGVRTGGAFLASRARKLGLIDGVRNTEATLLDLAKAN